MLEITAYMIPHSRSSYQEIALQHVYFNSTLKFLTIYIALPEYTCEIQTAVIDFSIFHNSLK